jgi:hypothetical protein
MRGDTGIIIIRARFPGLQVKQAGIVQSVFKFRARTFHAELNDGVIYIHFYITHFNPAIIIRRWKTKDLLSLNLERSVTMLFAGHLPQVGENNIP